MDIGNIHPIWWIPDRKPQTQQRENCVHSSISFIRMDLPLAQDSIPHLPGRADGEQGAKKPESHS